MSTRIGRKIWYSRINPQDSNDYDSLLGHPSNIIGRNSLIVCYENTHHPISGMKISNDNPRRIYSMFRNYIEYFDFFVKINKKYWTFHEVIMGNQLQKPRFDLDLNGVIEEYAKNLLDNLITSIIYVLNKFDLKLNLENDVLIFSSHSNEKYSYHLIINNYYHYNNHEAREFYRLVIEYLKTIQDNYCDSYIDYSMYSSTKQFRIYYNYKFGSNRIKKFNYCFDYQGKNYISSIPNCQNDQFNIEILNRSLITFTSECKLIPINVEIKTYENNISEISDPEANRLFTIFENCIGKGAFNVRRIENGKIDLDRIAKSFCRICNREHENENGILFVKNNNLYFNCRRNNKSDLISSNIVIGNLEINVPEVVNSKLVIDNKIYEKNNIVEELPKIKKIIISKELPKINKLPKLSSFVFDPNLIDKSESNNKKSKKKKSYKYEYDDFNDMRSLLGIKN